jgi:type IV pilus assembly protein PilQ
MKKIKYIIFVFILLSTSTLTGQDRFIQLTNNLDVFAKETPALNELIELSVDDTPIEGFLRMLSKSNELNISIQEGVKGNVNNDFSNARVKDVLIYVCKEYELDIEFIGNILFFKRYIAPQKIIKPVEKKINVSYNDKNRFLSVDLKKEDISEIAKVISEKSGKSVVVYPNARGTKVSGYIQNRPFEKVLEKITSSNGLIVTKTKDDFYVINKEVVQRNSNNASNQSGKTNSSNELINISIKEGLFSIEANDAPIGDIIMSLSEKLNVNYFFYSFPTEKITLYVDNMNFEEFLSSVLIGTKHTYKKTNNVYLIGERIKEGFRTTELITLKNRSVEKVLKIIPGDLKKSINVNVFTDLNGLVVSGSSEEIYELKRFVETIDIVVPVITIDLIIVEVNKINGISGGVEAGLKTTSNTTVTNGNTSKSVSCTACAN